MSTITIPFTEVYEDTPAVIMARITDVDGVNINQASVSSVTLAVWDKDSTSTTAVSTSTLTVSTCIYTTLQTTNWTADSIGYNFKDTLSTSAMSTAGHRYLAQYDIVPASGGSYPVQFEFLTRKRY